MAGKQSRIETFNEVKQRELAYHNCIMIGLFFMAKVCRMWIILKCLGNRRIGRF